MGIEIAGLGGLIALGLSIWAIVNIVGSPIGTGAKVLWTLFVIVLPVLGFLVWFFAGPRSSAQHA